jgi:hypothetical protein
MGLFTKNHLPYDEVISGIQKMIRRGKEKEALLLAYELTASGYGAALARRLMIIAGRHWARQTRGGIAMLHGVHAVVVISVEKRWLAMAYHALAHRPCCALNPFDKRHYQFTLYIVY